MEQSEYYPFFRNYTLALVLLDNYGRFAIISCLLTVRVTGCHCVLVSTKQLIGEKCVSKAQKCGYEITQWSTRVHVSLQAVFFSSFPYLQLKRALGDVPLTRGFFCSRIFCIATWQLQHPFQKSISNALRRSLVNIPLKFCHTIDAYIQRCMYIFIYVYTHI